VLLIDCDHTSARVNQTFEMCSPFERDGGIVAFHDIVTAFRGYRVRRGAVLEVSQDEA